MVNFKPKLPAVAGRNSSKEDTININADGAQPHAPVRDSRHRQAPPVTVGALGDDAGTIRRYKIGPDEVASGPKKHRVRPDGRVRFKEPIQQS